MRDAVALRAAPQSGHEQLYEEFGPAIIGGEFEPGDPISIEDYGMRAGWSRTICREAQRVLQSKGLIHTFHGSGTVVAPHSAWHWLDRDVIRWCAGKNQAWFADFLDAMREAPELPGNPFYDHLMGMA